MIEPKNEFAKILSELESEIKDPRDLEIAKSKLFEVGMLFMDVATRALESYTQYEMLSKRIDKMQKSLKKIEQDILSKKIQIGEFKNLDFEIKKFNLNLELGTENAFLTSMLIPIISALISILLGKKSKDVTNTKYIIKPIYINQNLIKILIFGIFDIKMFHIINILYSLIKKEGENKNERTSNRRSYDYGYE